MRDMHRLTRWGLTFGMATLLVISGFGVMFGYVEASDDKDRIERAEEGEKLFPDQDLTEESRDKKSGSGLDGLANSAWPKFQYDNRNTGLTPHDTSHVDGSEEWQVSLSDQVDSSPAVGGDGTIYIGSREEVGQDTYDAYLYAVEPGGVEKWNLTLNDQVSSSPAIGDNGTIYIGSRAEIGGGEYDGYLHAIEPGGVEKWTVPLGGYGYSSPAIADDGTIYIASYEEISAGVFDAHLHAIEPNGNEKWTAALGDYVYSSPAIAEDGTVYIGSYELVSGSEFDAYLHAIEPSGEEKWRTPLTDNIQSSPTVGEDGTIYIGSYEDVGDYEYDGYLHAVESNGSIDWSIEMGDYGALDAAIDENGIIYVGSYVEVADYEYDGQFHAVKANGSIKWSIDMHDYGGSAPSISGDGTVYVSSNEEVSDSEYDGYINAVQPDGNIEWSNHLGGLVGGPAIGGDGTIYVGSSNSSGGQGALHAIHGGEEYELTIQADEGGTTDPKPGTEMYQEGEEVTVEAVPDDGWTFDEWTGDVPTGESGISINVTMDQNRTITAHFSEVSSDEHVLTVEIKGQGAVEVDGQEVSDGWSETYQDGTLIGLKAVPDTDWIFDNWTGDVPLGEEGTSINVTMDQNRTITAHFSEVSSDEHVLTVEIKGQGAVEVDDQEVNDGWSETYQNGTLVGLEAFHDTGWIFDEWTGDLPTGEGGTSINVTMDKNRTITAHFSEVSSDEYVLTVEIEGQGSVEVDGKEVSDGWSETYQDGTLIGLKAFHDTGWIFDNWTGDVPTGESGISINVTMDQNRTITAHFSEVSSDENVLTIEIEGEGSVEVDDQEVSNGWSETYQEGTLVQLEAFHDTGWIFDNWTGDVPLGEEGSAINVTMDQNRTITAHFSEVSSDEHVLTVEIEGEGSVEVDGQEVSDGWSETYQDGTLIGLKAFHDTGWIFDNWTGDVPLGEEGTSINVTMDQNRTITAHFSEVSSDEYVLTVEIEGQGTVEVDGGEVKLPYEEKYLEGTEVNLTAIPNESWEFAEWTGIENTGENITIVMDKNKEITAVFEEGPYFEVEIYDYDEEVTEGDEVVVQYRVHNVGEVEGSQDVVFLVNGEEVETETDLTLDPNETTADVFRWESESGEHNLTVETENDEHEVTVSVEQEEDTPGFTLGLLTVALTSAIAIYEKKKQR